MEGTWHNAGEGRCRVIECNVDSDVSIDRVLAGSITRFTNLNRISSSLSRSDSVRALARRLTDIEYRRPVNYQPPMTTQ